MPQGCQRFVQRERERAAGRSRRDGPIVAFSRWGTAGSVTRGNIRSRQAPDAFAIIDPSERIGNGVGAIGQGGPAEILDQM